MAISKVKRAHVVIQEELINEIDQLVGPRKRSQFITEAVEKELDHLKFLKAVRETAGAWKAEDHPELKKGTSKWVETIRRRDEERFEGIAHG